MNNSRDLLPLPKGITFWESEPKVSPEIDAELWRSMNPHPDTGYNLKPMGPQKATLALQALRQHEAACAPVDKVRMIHWLQPLVLSTANGPDRDEFGLKITMLLNVMDGVASGALNAATQREAMRTFKFFPTVSEVYQFLEEHGHRIDKRRRALARIVAINETPAAQRDR